MDSYWHKDQTIPTNKIDGLESALNGKASTQALDNKVDKVPGKSLLLDSEIERLAGLSNDSSSDTIATTININISDLGLVSEEEITETIITNYINSLGLVKEANEFYIVQVEDNFLKVFDLTTDLVQFQIIDLTTDITGFQVFDLTNDSNEFQIFDLTESGIEVSDLTN
jgi:hypothetical protein